MGNSINSYFCNNSGVGNHEQGSPKTAQMSKLRSSAFAHHGLAGKRRFSMGTPKPPIYSSLRQMFVLPEGDFSNSGKALSDFIPKRSSRRERNCFFSGVFFHYSCDRHDYYDIYHPFCDGSRGIPVTSIHQSWNRFC